MSFWRKEDKPPEPGEWAALEPEAAPQEMPDGVAKEAPPRSELADGDLLVREKLADMAAGKGEEAPVAAADAEATAETAMAETDATEPEMTEDALPPPEDAAKKRRRRAVRVKQVLPALAATVVYLVLAFFMFKNAIEAAPAQTTLSLRYAEPISTGRAAGVKHTLADPEKTQDFVATFWYENPGVEIAADRAKAQTPVLFVDGDMATVYQADFINGTYPAALEKHGIALSEGLSWQLFGGMGVVGTELEWQGGTYTVRGVFKGDDLLLLAQVDTAEWAEKSAAGNQNPVAAPDDASGAVAGTGTGGQAQAGTQTGSAGVLPGYTGVELVGETQDDPRQAAETFITQSGLGKPLQIVSGGSIPGILNAMAWLPAVCLAVWAVAKLLGLLRHSYYWLRQFILFGLLLALALALPRLLDLLPGWMVPTQWSDLDHWSAFAKEVATRVNEWLSLAPSMVDVMLKKRLILQVVLLVPALFALVGTMRRWAVHIRRSDAALRLAAARAAGQEDAETLAMAEQLILQEGAPLPADGPAKGKDEHDDIELLKSEKHTKHDPLD